MGKHTYYVQKHLQHNGKTFNPGDEIATIETTDDSFSPEHIAEAIGNESLGLEKPKAEDVKPMQTFSPGGNGDGPADTHDRHGKMTKDTAERNRQTTLRIVDTIQKQYGEKPRDMAPEDSPKGKQPVESAEGNTGDGLFVPQSTSGEAEANAQRSSEPANKLPDNPPPADKAVAPQTGNKQATNGNGNKTADKK